MKKHKIITIKKPRVEKTTQGKYRLVSAIDVSGDVRSVWFEVEEKYARYLCEERSDAFLIGLLNWAMREGFDFICEAPVSEELHYQLINYLIPSLKKGSRVLHAPSIKADISSKQLPNAGAVGTGISCGVDSLHVVANQWKSPYPNLRLTHLVLNNVGAYRLGKNQYSWQIKHAEQFCNEYGFELIKTDSNFAQIFPQNHLLTHTYSSCFAIYALQKLWSVFFYASSGYDFSAFGLKDNEKYSADHYELLSLQCFSTHSLRIHSEGGAKTRFEKMQQLITFTPAQKYLHVCTNDEGENCNLCGKCFRTLITLDALGALEQFQHVFDINYYKKNRQKYLRQLLLQQFLPSGDIMTKEAFAILKKNISPANWIFALATLPIKYLRGALLRTKYLKTAYRKCFRRGGR